MGHSPAQADVHAVVVRTANRLVGPNACELGQCGSRKSRVEWASAADSAHGHLLVNVDGLVFVQTQNMRVFRFDYGIGIE